MRDVRVSDIAPAFFVPSLRMTPTTALVLEWSAVALNITFTILIGLERRAGWLFGFVAASLSIALYVDKDAWIMAALNAFYAVMWLHGWWTWGRAVKDQGVITLPVRRHVLLIGLTMAGTCLLAAVMLASSLDIRYPWMEAFIASSAMVATWLMGRKVLENWVYWTAGDIVAVLYNHWIGYDYLALLNVVYILLAVVGFLRWRKQLRSRLAVAP